jgi:mannose-6-phosphate isomerase-like protein (cupin superfamily)
MKKVFICLSGLFICLAGSMQQKQTPVSNEVYLSKVLTGTVFSTNEEKAISDLPWNPHASFKGVSLKHLIIGKDTDNKMSCHLVKIEPEAVLDTHQHDGKMEVHKVVSGSGQMFMDGKIIDYSVGSMCIIPENTPHKVVAGADGLYIVALFTPSLL